MKCRSIVYGPVSIAHQMAFKSDEWSAQQTLRKVAALDRGEHPLPGVFLGNGVDREASLLGRLGRDGADGRQAQSRRQSRQIFLLEQSGTLCGNRWAAETNPVEFSGGNASGNPRGERSHILVLVNNNLFQG